MGDVEVDPIRVLHVDDDPEIVDLATTFLERENDRLSVDAAETAEEALAAVSAGDVHCIISDYQLPDTDCLSFVEAVRAEVPGLPFVLFTGRDRTQLEEGVLDRVTAYLQKGSGTEQYTELAEAIVTAVDASDARTDGGRPSDRDGDRFRPDGGTGDTAGDRPTLASLELTDASVLEDALDAIDDVFFVLDPDHELAYWNRQLETVTGYETAEVAGMSPLDFFVGEDHDDVVAALESLADTGHATVEATVEAKSGEEIPAEFRCADLTNADGEVVGYVGIARDITDRLSYQRELERQNERLEELVGAISHDLRNPLNVMTGRIELARDLGDEEHFEALDRATRRMETLISDLVELARKGQLVTETHSVSLPNLTRVAWEGLATGDATLTVETDLTVEADRDRLRQLVENLLTNAVEHGSTSPRQAGDAIKHGGEGVSVTVGDLEDGFYVADDGPGIDPADRDSVFEYGETTAEDGTGIGLAIVQRVAEAHGWSVSVTESEAGGARFEVTGVDGTRPFTDRQ